MIDWKRFEDEVPTENRGVIMGHQSGPVWAIDTMTADGVDDEPYWENTFLGAIGRDSSPFTDEVCWRELADNEDHTHWAYVDPPSDLGATSAPEGKKE